MNRIKTIAIVLASLFVGASGCNSKSEDEQRAKTTSSDKMQFETAASEPEAIEEEEGLMADEMPMPSAAPAKPGAKRRKAVGGMMDSETKSDFGSAERDQSGGGGGGGEQGPAPRAWFPETFLFNPLVVTDDQGHASVSVKVPDRLTTWRVLGLAHSRSGSQAGSVATFEGTLPAYVDPVVPSFLRAGDRVRVPIQLVNNTDTALQTSLKVEVEGGILKSNAGPVSLGKRSSTVRYVELLAEQAGELRLMARMGDADMVVRTIEVRPTGEPVSQTQSGTLAAPRTVTMVGSEAAGASKGTARLSVFPGALSLLRSELGASVHRGGVAADAFALLLAGKAPELLRSLGDEPDEEQLRKLTITASQKIMRHARVLSIENAALIAEAARSHVGNPVLERLGQRAISTIESSQAPDGTCGGQSGWTLQRLLVATADCARAAHDSPNVSIRASGAFERNAKEIADPYTAAAILAANAARGELAKTLRAQVLEAIEERENGAKILAVPAGVVRADGRAPSVVEATAMAVLALGGVADAPLADLGATILASYAPHWGWGDGRANLVCMESAMALFKDPLPEVVAIRLSKDGEVIAESNLERDKVREVLQLGAEGLDIGGAHQWSVSADPAVPGLGFSLSLTSWVPWTAAEMLGTELQVEVPKSMSVGKAAPISVQAIAPSGTPFEISLALPAGVQVDTTSLDRLVETGALSRYEQVDGAVTLHASALQPAKRFAASIRVIPTLSGRLQSGPAFITVGREKAHLPPATFAVSPN